MSSDPAPTILRCPVCGRPLARTAADYRCANKHTFDVGRQGYVNLLMSHQKQSKEPGDSAEMIQSRRRFLTGGFYAPVADGLNTLVEEAVAARPRGDAESFNVLDAGCGEGYYLKRLKDALGASHPRRRFGFYGLDISKPAIRAATHYDKSITWVVGSVTSLPLLDASLDVVENVFASSNFGEFARVLKDGGRLLLAYPGPRHLYSLRRAIYEQIIEHSTDDLLRRGAAHFSTLKTAHISYETEVSGDAVRDLLTMTPYYWNISPETRLRVESLTRLPLEVDIAVSVLGRRPQ